MMSAQFKQKVIALGLVAIVSSLLLVAQQAHANPVVETGISPLSPDGQHVKVYLPGVFHMVLDTRGKNHEGYRFSETVLSGLVRIEMDRVLDAQTGRRRGPIQVKVMGMTMYDNHAEPIKDSLIPGLHPVETPLV